MTTTINTETETDAMLAEVLELSGRELDALVAVELMGWRWFASKPSLPVFKEPRVVLLPPETGGWERWNFNPAQFEDVTGEEDTYERFTDWDNACSRGGPGPSSEQRGLPFYSTDIADAWEIVEKMAAPAFSMDQQGDWCCSFGGGWRTVGSGGTAPAAICRAALLAVRRKKEGLL